MAVGVRTCPRSTITPPPRQTSSSQSTRYCPSVRVHCGTSNCVERSDEPSLGLTLPAQCRRSRLMARDSNATAREFATAAYCARASWSTATARAESYRSREAAYVDGSHTCERRGLPTPARGALRLRVARDRLVVVRVLLRRAQARERYRRIGWRLTCIHARRVDGSVRHGARLHRMRYELAAPHLLRIGASVTWLRIAVGRLDARCGRLRFFLPPAFGRVEALRDRGDAIRIGGCVRRLRHRRR